MPEQNSVLFNIAQSKSDQQKAQARSNIGVLHNVNYISNAVSPPTLAEVQAMLDAGDYVVLQYDSGTPGEPAVPMPVIQDNRGGSPFVMFCAVNDSGAITISLTGSGFGSASVNLFAVGKLDIITLPNNTASMSGLYTYIATAMGLGKTPIIKYEESTSPQTWGYYWPSFYETGTFEFRRVTGTGVLGIEVDSSNNITYTSVGYGSTVDCRLPIKVDAQDKITNNGYNCSVVGNNSWAEGNGTTSKGHYSHAEGHDSFSWGESSHSEGSGLGYGDCSHSEGNGVATGDGAHAEGTGGTTGDMGGVAYGQCSHAEGTQPSFRKRTSAASNNVNLLTLYDATDVVTGMYAVVLPLTTQPLQFTSVLSVAGSNVETADAVTVIAGQDVIFTKYIAYGDHSHIEGQNTRALGTASHAEGYGTTASGDYSHVEGYSNQSSGDYSHAEGAGNRASGDYSHAEGRSAYAEGEASHAECAGDASGDYSHAEGTSVAEGECSHAEGSTCFALATASHAEGSGTYSAGDDSHSEGEMTLSLGKNSHAEGQGYYYNRNITADATNTDRFFIDDATGIVTGNWVILKDAVTKVVTVDGLQIIVSDNVTVENGDWVKFSSYAASGAASHTEGVNTSAVGTASHAEGYATVANGNYSHSGGNGCNAKGEASIAHGGGLTMNTQYGAAFGKFNQDYNAIFAIGVGASGGSRADALKVDTNGHVWIRKNGVMVDLSV